MVCRDFFLLQDWAHPKCMNFVQAATMLYCLYPLALCVLLTRPHPFVCSYPGGRSLRVVSQKSFKLVRSLVGCMG